MKYKHLFVLIEYKFNYLDTVEIKFFMILT